MPDYCSHGKNYCPLGLCPLVCVMCNKRVHRAIVMQCPTGRKRLVCEDCEGRTPSTWAFVQELED